MAGKSTTTGRLIFELGGIPERELEKLKAEADALGKSSFAFAFYMDTQKEERARGVTISCTTKEFFTEKWHYTIIDAPGERAETRWPVRRPMSEGCPTVPVLCHDDDEFLPSLTCSPHCCPVASPAHPPSLTCSPHCCPVASHPLSPVPRIAVLLLQATGISSRT